MQMFSFIRWKNKVTDHVSESTLYGIHLFISIGKNLKMEDEYILEGRLSNHADF